MQEVTVAPADPLAQLSGIPPGPELAAALAALHLPTVPNTRVVEVLRAHYRQLAHAHAGLAAALLEVARTTPWYDTDDDNPDRSADPAPGSEEWLTHAERAMGMQASAEGEIAAALRWTPGKAGWELARAHTLIDEMPAVYAALVEGRIDRPKADVFAEYLNSEHTRLSRAQIDRLITRFLPPAERWTRRQLAARLLRAILAIDPQAARDRYRQAVRERGVSCYLHEDTATAVITADGLPPDEATAACARLDRLAETIQRAGHPGRLRQISADLYLGMLDGRWHGHTEQQIIADLLAQRRPEDQPLTPTRPADPTDPAGSGPVSRGFPTHARDRRPAWVQKANATDPAPEQPAASDPELVEPGAPGWAARAGIEIRVGLATLLGHDDHPGEIPALGPVTADVARTAVAAQRRGAEWRFAVVDEEGYLMLAGVTRRRPALGRDPDPGPVRGGIVELHLRATLLADLAADPIASGGAWAGVIADIAGQYARRDQLQAAVDTNPRARFARGALARHIQIRDRSCCHPGCTRPATTAELDHTRDHAAGGPTTAANIDPNCTRHHWYKTTLGWRLRQPEPGHYEWTSPLGRTYRTRGEPIRPDLPGPQQDDPTPERRPDPEFCCPDGPILRRPLKRPEPPPPRPPPPPPDDDPPPF